MTLHQAVVRHASVLCERELARRERTAAVQETSRAVALAVARWLADSAADDATVRQTLEEIYLTDCWARALS